MPNLDQLMSLLPKAKPKQRGFDPDYLSDESIDPSVRADAGLEALEGEDQNHLRSELKLMAGQPESTSPQQVGALQQMLRGTQTQRAASPLVAQQAEYDQAGLDTRGAIDQGFRAKGDGMSAVQARNIYKRNIEEEKLRQPIQERNIMESGLNHRQGQQIDATQRMIETQMEPANRAEDRLSDFYQSLSAGGAPNDVKSVSRTGVTFQNRPQPNDAANNAIYRDLSTARNNLGKAGVTDPFASMGSGSAEQQFFEQTMNTIIGKSKLGPDDAALVQEYIRNPEGMTFDEAFPRPTPGTPDEMDWNEARRLVLLLRGSL